MPTAARRPVNVPGPYQYSITFVLSYNFTWKSAIPVPVVHPGLPLQSVYWIVKTLLGAVPVVWKYAGTPVPELSSQKNINVPGPGILVATGMNVVEKTFARDNQQWLLAES